MQDGSIEVDGGVEVSKRSPGKLRQLNTDTGLYVGEFGVQSNIVSCSEITDARKRTKSNKIILKLYYFCILGGVADIMYYTNRHYYSGIIGCISEIVLGGELKLSLDPETLGLAHNVEPGYF